MSEKEYMRLVNRNILSGWAIIGGILLLSYIIEVAKGLRTVPYVLVFSAILFIPILYAGAVYHRSKGSESLKIIFMVGYGMLYTFVMMTSETPVTFVYILPMVSLLLVYGDKIALGILFIYVTFINIGSIILQNEGLLDLFTVISTRKGKITYWEIQMACIILTGVFVYQSCDLLMKRNVVIHELRDDAFIDGLTGLKNVRFLEEYKTDIAKFNKFKNFSIAFIDIDDFKQFNTRFGHTFGDLVLKNVGLTLLQITADVPNTYAIRNGGDEFVIVSVGMLPGEFIKTSKTICDKIRNMNLIYDGEDVNVTVSIGVATGQDAYKVSDFMGYYNLADERNEQAKREGKNRVIYD